MDMMEVKQPTPFDVITREAIDEFASFARETMERGVSDDHEAYHFPDAQTDINEEAEKHDLKFVGRGSNRLVFVMPDDNEQKFVLKVGFPTNFRDAAEQNRVEALIWNALEDANEAYTQSAKRRLLPVIESAPDNHWLVMPHGTSVTENDEEQWARKTIRHEFPFLPRDADLTLSENIVKRDDSFVICDYGSYIPESFIQNTIGAEYLDHIGQENLV